MSEVFLCRYCPKTCWFVEIADSIVDRGICDIDLSPTLSARSLDQLPGATLELLSGIQLEITNARNNASPLCPHISYDPDYPGRKFL